MSDAMAVKCQHQHTTAFLSTPIHHFTSSLNMLRFRGHPWKSQAAPAVGLINSMMEVCISSLLPSCPQPDLSFPLFWEMDSLCTQPTSDHCKMLSLMGDPWEEEASLLSMIPQQMGFVSDHRDRRCGSGHSMQWTAQGVVDGRCRQQPHRSPDPDATTTNRARGVTDGQ